MVFMNPGVYASAAAASGRRQEPRLYVKPDDRYEVNNVVQHHLELGGRNVERTLRGAFIKATRFAARAASDAVAPLQGYRLAHRS